MYSYPVEIDFLTSPFYKKIIPVLIESRRISWARENHFLEKTA